MGEELHQVIRERLESVQERIAQAAQSSRHNPSDVRLVVVSKGQPVEVISSAIQAGVTLFGENYPEQAQPKILALRAAQGIEWHMIGHLQSRKASIVVDLFSMLHSVDRIDLAEKLERLLTLAEKTLPVLLEFNLADEESKSGWNAANESNWDTLLPGVERVLSFSHLKVRGLMAMPPLFPDPEDARPYFVKLVRLREYLSKKFHAGNFVDLSMGTSADFEVAVQEGATIVRVGTAILGPRPLKQV